MEMLERQSTMLKRRMNALIIKENRRGLSGQENHLYQHFIKQWHQIEGQLNTGRRT
jgi:hypothetical protein